jgi:hypothetical protein
MVFSLFERYKPEHTVQLKNPNKVVIGSGTDLERAFQIGNFMNMFQYNIEIESQSMTNSVIKHNLMVEVDLLIKHCINNSNDGCAEQWYNHHKDQINTIVESLVEELELIKKLEKQLPHLKRDVKNETKQLINLMRRTAVGKYNMIVNEIVFTFPEYFEYIKH